MSVFEFDEYHKYLKFLLDSKKLKNSAYSLRSFSRDLKLAPSRLSLILQGKQGLSFERALEVAKLLGLNGEECQYFCNLVMARHARSKKERFAAQENLKGAKYEVIDPTQGQFVMDWIHSALLEYISKSPGKLSSKKLAQDFNVKEQRVITSLQRLVEMNLVSLKDDFYTTSSTHTTSTHDIPSEAIKTGHEVLLDLAKEKINNTPVEKREFASLIFSMSANEIQEFKSELRHIRRSLVEKYSKNENRTGIYQFSLQFYPLIEELS